MHIHLRHLQACCCEAAVHCAVAAAYSLLQHVVTMPAGAIKPLGDCSIVSRMHGPAQKLVLAGMLQQCIT